uniref:Uncharacterized protein n=1 Tax=Aegilops tauschii subsp. strangulata TaxID=200361 RepID=A0A452ZC10_AEGTS
MQYSIMYPLKTWLTPTEPIVPPTLFTLGRDTLEFQDRSIVATAGNRNGTKTETYPKSRLQHKKWPALSATSLTTVVSNVFLLGTKLPFNSCLIASNSSTKLLYRFLIERNHETGSALK